MPFGEYVRESGLAIPLVCLYFGAIWLLPLITALVAGRHRRGRGPQRHAEDDPHALGRPLAGVHGQAAGRADLHAVASWSTYVGVGVVVGGIVFGFEPLTTLSGTTVGVGRALYLTAAGTLTYALPLMAIAVDRAAAVHADAATRPPRSSAR